MLILLVGDPCVDYRGVECQSWEEPLKVPSTDLAFLGNLPAFLILPHGLLLCSGSLHSPFLSPPGCGSGVFPSHPCLKSSWRPCSPPDQSCRFSKCLQFMLPKCFLDPWTLGRGLAGDIRASEAVPEGVRTDGQPRHGQVDLC